MKNVVVPPKGIEPSISWLRTRHVNRYTTGAQILPTRAGGCYSIPYKPKTAIRTGRRKSKPRMYRVSASFRTPKKWRCPGLDFAPSRFYSGFPTRPIHVSA